jgi:tol-pal system protein YbgF
MIKRRLFLWIGFFVLSPLAHAEVPVVDNSQYATQENDQSVLAAMPSNHEPLTEEQRLTKLESQMANQNQMDLQTQIQNLQKEIQELRGRLDMQAHSLQTIEERLRMQTPNSEQTLPITPASNPPAKKILPESSDIIKDPAAKNMPSNHSLPDEEAYQSAIQQIKGKNYPSAIKNLKAYLLKFPSGRYVSNTHYWLGELYLLRNNQAQAIKEFNIIVNQYPQNQRMKETLLKLGTLYYDQGNKKKGREFLARVQRDYPSTVAAKLASEKLDGAN